LWGAIGAVGGSVGLLAGGLLTRFAGWEYIFYLKRSGRRGGMALAPRVSRRCLEGRAARLLDALGGSASRRPAGLVSALAFEGARGGLVGGVHSHTFGRRRGPGVAFL